MGHDRFGPKDACPRFECSVCRDDGGATPASIVYYDPYTASWISKRTILSSSKRKTCVTVLSFRP
jgi:hypothetical protein